VTVDLLYGAQQGRPARDQPVLGDSPRR